MITYVVEARVPANGPTPKQILESMPSVYAEVPGGTFPVATWNLTPDVGTETPILGQFYSSLNGKATPIDQKEGIRESLASGFLTALQRAWRRASQ
jgi:hypothetical protein